MIFHLLRKFSTKPSIESDFRIILSKYKDLINELSNSGNGVNSLDRVSVKLSNSKKSVALSEIGTLNVIDPLRVELTTHDPQLTKSLVSSLQSAGLNLTVNILTQSKIVILFPKSTSSNKNSVIDQLKKRTESFKNDLRDLRRKDINEFRSSTKDKDQIRNFELQIQKRFENLISEIDKELDLQSIPITIMNRYSRKRAQLNALQAEIKRKLYEYNLIATLNSKTEVFGEVLMSEIENECEQKDIFDNFSHKIDNMGNKLDLLNSTNFLLPSWPQSIHSIKEKIQSRNISSAADIKIFLAALIFNANISVTPENEHKRQELLDIFDIIMQM